MSEVVIAALCSGWAGPCDGSVRSGSVATVGANGAGNGAPCDHGGSLGGHLRQAVEREAAWARRAPTQRARQINPARAARRARRIAPT